MKDEPRIKVDILAFFESYVRAFEEQDPSRLADHIGFPCHPSGDGVTVFQSPEQYVEGIRPLLALYRDLDVATADMMVHSAKVLSERLALVVLDWYVRNSENHLLYTHMAGYTLVRPQERWQIVAIAFNEMPKIRALMHAAAARTTCGS